MFSDHAIAGVDIGVDTVSELNTDASESTVAVALSAPIAIKSAIKKINNPWTWPSNKTRPLAAEMPTPITSPTQSMSAAGLTAIKRSLGAYNEIPIVRPLARETEKDYEPPPAPPSSPEEARTCRFYSKRPPCSSVNKPYRTPCKYNESTTTTTPKKSNNSNNAGPLFGITNPAYKRPHELFPDATSLPSDSWTSFNQRKRYFKNEDL